jgi:hypothetical protein
MLLYTAKTEFTAVDRAVAAWQSGQIDWLVIPERDLAKQATKLRPFEQRAFSGSIPEKSSSYVLIRRLGQPRQSSIN